MLAELIKQNRSCRRFYQDHEVDENTLRSLVDLARNSASAANLQPLKYMLSCDPIKNNDIFSCLGWAAYLEDWKGPVEGEQPSAYIVFLGDTTRNSIQSTSLPAAFRHKKTPATESPWPAAARQTK